MTSAQRLTRRDFLKLVGLGALGWLFPSPWPTRRRWTGAWAVEAIDPRFGVLVTTDDGYSSTFADMARAIIRRQVPIAFFAVGRALPSLANADGENLLEGLVEVGGIICNHSATHPYFTHLSEKEIEEQLLGFEEMLAQHLGRDYVRWMKAEFPYFRIPFGAGDNLARVIKVSRDLGYHHVWWTWDDMGVVAPHLPKGDAAAGLREPLYSVILDDLRRHIPLIQPGDIVLVHSNSWSLAVLDELLDHIQQVGVADPIRSLAVAASLTPPVPPLPRHWGAPWGGRL